MADHIIHPVRKTVMLLAVAIFLATGSAHGEFFDDPPAAGLPLLCPSQPCPRSERGTTTYGPKGENWMPPPTDEQRKAWMAAATAGKNSKPEVSLGGALKSLLELPDPILFVPVLPSPSDKLQNLEYRIHELEARAR